MYDDTTLLIIEKKNGKRLQCPSLGKHENILVSSSRGISAAVRKDALALEVSM